ncbi:MAG: cupin domain-containing protein, partial [Mesorhizobium sp.]
MKPHSLSARRIGLVIVSVCAFGLMTSASMPADSKFAVEPVVEKKVKELPSGPLYWRLDSLPTLAQAQGAA